MINTINCANYLEKSCDYGAYREFFEKSTSEFKAGLPVSIDHAEYLAVNWQRSIRNEKTFEISEALQHKLEMLNQKITWLVITEPWCGDSAQCLPAIYKIASASNGKINLRIVYRDQHHDLIDAFLTNGARAIPKLIQLNESVEVTGIWGPRPEAAQDLVNKLKSNSSTADLYKEELHRWYAENKNNDIQEELLRILP
ncbi:MAG: hypothetical protein RIQ47_949 [Bacteroidota bacterium]